MLIPVDSYRCELRANNMNRVVLNFANPKKPFKGVVIYFDDHTVYNQGEKIKVMNGGTITYRLPLDRYADTIDLLRNEKPIYFYASPLHGTLQDGYLDWAWIQTDEHEPVGDAE